jgi:hypothetical protein
MPIKGTDQAATRREHVLENAAKRVQMVDAFGGITTEGNYTKAFSEDAEGNMEYIGTAQIGTSESEEGWQIKKLVRTGGSLTAIRWADGTDEFTKVWDDRETYSYS